MRGHIALLPSILKNPARTSAPEGVAFHGPINAPTPHQEACDFCNSSAFGLMRRHSGGKTFCSPHCEASFTNCRMIEGAEIEGPVPDGPHGDFIAALRYP